ncbi:MAG: DedA family protein [Turicibacter sp.]|nr:DedA family protein [Turicibacter sp.]
MLSIIGSLDINTVLDYLGKYGVLFLFIIVFLEYLNLPGLPAGVVMPATGIVIARGEVGFWPAILVSLLAGLLGSVILYFAGFLVGKRLIDYLYKKFKSTRKPLEKVHDAMDKYSDRTMFLTRLIPIIRTIIPLVEGSSKKNFAHFLIYSSLGIFIWNLATISLGFYFEQWFLS